MKRLLTTVLFFAVSSHAAAITIISEDFETGTLPPGWSTTQLVPSVGWEFGTDLGSQYFPIAAHTAYAASNDDAHDDASTNQNNAAEDRLITPALDLSWAAGQAIRVKFAYVQPDDYGSTGFVEVSVNGNAFVPVEQVPPAPDWSDHSVLLSDYAGESNVRIAFRHNDNGGWGQGFAIDDVLIETLSSRDAAMEGVGGPAFYAIGGTVVQGRISNQGGEGIDSFGFSYSVEGGPVQSGTVDLPSTLQTGAEADVGLSNYTFPAPGDYAVELEITSVNGQSDQNPANDVAQGVIRVLSQIPVKRVVLEQHTGSWCQFCPDGTARLEDVQQTYPNVIGVSVHNSDAMSIPDGTEVSDAFIGGYPAGTIDRAPAAGELDVSVNRGDWARVVAERLTVLVAADVQLIDVSYDAGIRQLTASVQTTFFGADGGDLRLNLWVVEDGVTGTGSGYDQFNFYDTEVGHPFEGAGNPIVGFVHDGVVRAMLGGAWGTSGVVPMTIAAGESYSQSYQYTLGPDEVPERIRLVGVLSRYGAGVDEREIVNAVEKPLIIDIHADGFE